MILRRLGQHVREQNWLAVGLDFLIVVAGVYLGIALGDWNDERARDREYGTVRALLAEETRANLARVATLRGETERALTAVRAGLDALRTCDAAGAPGSVEAALDEATLSYGMTIQTHALDRLLGSPDLLARASPAERARLGAYHTVLRELGEDLALNEREALEGGPVRSVSVAFGPVEPFPGGDYRGAPITFDGRRTLLAVPLAQACADPALRHALRRWEFWQETTPLFASRLEDAMTQNLAELNG